MNVGRTHQWRGTRTEATVVKELVEREIGVSAPVFGHQRYDIIIDREGELERVQVKTAFDIKCRRDTVAIDLTSTVYQSDGTPKKSFYTSDEIDSYIVYCPERDALLYVRFEESPKTMMRFSFRPREEYNSHNRKTVNFAEDYLLDARLRG